MLGKKQTFNDGLAWLGSGSDNDLFYGEAGNDTIYGSYGNDFFYGSYGNDILYGGEGKDNFTGASGGNPGVGSLDTFTGGLQADYFSLGSAGAVYYNDGNAATPGLNDYALITDFNSAEDMIELKGSSSQYVLGSSAGKTGTDIYLNTDGVAGLGARDELIGIVQGSGGLDLSASYFVYI